MESIKLDSDKSMDFILAGNALVTFKSLRTGNHFTYRIKKKKTQDIWFVSVLYDPSKQSFNYIGCITEDGRFTHTKGSQVNPDCISFRSFCWVWTHWGHPSVEIWHEGKCGRCGRILTEPESIRCGFGPHCRTKL